MLINQAQNCKKLEKIKNQSHKGLAEFQEKIGYKVTE